jgi:Glycosyltransferases involved in cell wall biogenesis
MIRPQETAVVIPAYKPDDRLPPYVSALIDAGIGCIVVADDGSGSDYRSLFDLLPENETVHTIHYEPNCGKGVALKRALSYIEENRPDARIIITADSDGQHTVKDVLRMVDAMGEDSTGVLLGSRDFSQENVPFKSRNGNRITSAVFKVLYGEWVSDTQTGLRAFARELLPMMIKVKGERYEYEMNVLIACAQKKIPMRALPIETVYENNNEGSHFRAFRDSARIYKVILGGFVKFIASSLISTGLDYVLYLIFLSLLNRYTDLGTQDHAFNFWFLHVLTSILIATVGARLISGITNYLLNRKMVFCDQGSAGKSFPRYLVVFLLNMLLSAVLTSTLHLAFGCNEKLIKLPVDLVLFFLSYRLQSRWVFRQKA